MSEKQSKTRGAIALAVVALWAAGPGYAQRDPSRDPVTDANTDTDTVSVSDATLHPPHLLDSPPPVYPSGQENSGLHPTVILLVTVTPDAKVTDIVVEHSAGSEFDAAAVEGVQTWKFEPAKRGQTPVASRIRVAIHFAQPEVGVHDQTSAYAAADTDAAFRTDAQVDAERMRSGGRGAADFDIDQDILKAAPVFSANDLLKRVPGLYASKPEGGAVGERFFLRGFDSEHGQDIEFKVGSMPLNQPSHIHGQGYTFQGFIIPEVVRQLRVTEGVYDPIQGDFAIAGTIEYELAVDERGVYAQTELGSFRTFRQTAIFAPEGGDPDTFGAFQLRRTDGFGQNCEGIDGSAMFQFGFGREKWRFRVHGSFGGARSDLAGVLRLDDIQGGEVGWLDVYPFDTALAQNGFSFTIFACKRTSAVFSKPMPTETHPATSSSNWTGAS